MTGKYFNNDTIAALLDESKPLADHLEGKEKMVTVVELVTGLLGSNPPLWVA
jgi:hypothetical protein